MSLNYSENKISGIIMNKNILRNVKYLEKLSRKAKEETKSKVDDIIDLYKTRKIAQIQTAENTIMKLINNDPKVQKSGMKLYQKKLLKHQEMPTLSRRLRQKQQLELKIKSSKMLMSGMRQNQRLILRLL